MALDIADLARRAAEHGGREAIASVSIRRELVALAGPAGALEPPRRTFDVMVRLLVRDGAGRLGVARCSTSISDAQLAALATGARAAAAAAPIDLEALPLVAAGPAHEAFDLLTADLDPARAVAVASAAADAIPFSVGGSRAARWRAEDVEVAVASADGALAVDRRTGAQLAAWTSDIDGILVGAAQAASPVEGLIDPLRVGLAAAPPEVALVRDGARVLASPGDPVVLLPSALAPLLEALARIACTGHAHATGSSPFTGRVGTPVAPAIVSLADDPGLLGGLARAIDVEGAPAERVALIEDGVEQDVVHDTRSALEAGARSTGHAAQLGGAVDGPLARNLVLAPGVLPSVEAAAGPGAIVVPTVERVALAGPGRTRFTAVGRAAYLMGAGEPATLLGDVVLMGDLTELLAGIDELGATVELVATVDRLPERTLATTCPAALTTGVTVLRS